MIELGKLRDEHREILRIVGRLGLLIAGSSPPPKLHLLALRHQLSSILIGHLKAEDWLLYPPLYDSRNLHIAATARAFSEEMGGLGMAYWAHCEQWNAVAIAGDWPGYCRDSRTLLDALTNRITRENRELYPLLEELDRAA